MVAGVVPKFLENVRLSLEVEEEKVQNIIK